MDIRSLRKTQEHDQGHESRARKTIKLSTYALLGLGSLTLYFLLRLHVFSVFGNYHAMATRLSLGGFFAMMILFAGKIVEVLLLRHRKSRRERYNLVRVIRLLSVLLLIVVVISFLFINWYTAAVSLGLISLILGFALQTPIASFIGWINIVLRAPYQVGDRIQIDTFKGDVVEIGYIDTTLWEFGGDYLTNDVPSGRLIRFPNSLVFQSPVYNYSWRRFPYIWNEIPFHVAYESDLAHVADTIKKIATDMLGEKMEANIREFKTLVSETPVDELEIKEYPFVAFRINQNTWVEVTLTYLVEPKKAAVTRTKLIEAVIGELLKTPDKVMFPKSNAR